MNHNYAYNYKWKKKLSVQCSEQCPRFRWLRFHLEKRQQLFHGFETGVWLFLLVEPTKVQTNSPGRESIITSQDSKHLHLVSQGLKDLTITSKFPSPPSSSDISTFSKRKASGSQYLIPSVHALKVTTELASWSSNKIPKRRQDEQLNWTVMLLSGKWTVLQ